MAQNYQMAIIIPGSQFHSFFQSDSCKEGPKLVLFKVEEILSGLEKKEGRAMLVVNSFQSSNEADGSFARQLRALAVKYHALLETLENAESLEEVFILAKPSIDDQDVGNLNIIIPESNSTYCKDAASIIFSPHTYQVNLTTIDIGVEAEHYNGKEHTLTRVQEILHNLPSSDGLPLETLKSHMIPSGSFYHGFTTRTGGVSSYPTMRSLPLAMSLRKKDTRVYVEENRKRLAKMEGFDYEKFESATAVHGIQVWVLGDEQPNTYDAMVTNKQGFTIAAPGADCQTLLFCDPLKKVVGAAHSGWKGTIDKIQQNVVRVMKERFSCDPSDILVAIGPSIGVCCYNVDEERAKNFVHAVGESVVQRRDDVAYLDLWKATVILLKEVGVKEENIDDGKRRDETGPNKGQHVTLCTVCHKEKFFSYRRDGPLFGNQIGFIGIKDGCF